MQNNPIIGITVDYQEKVNSYSNYPWFALRRHYTQCLEIFDCTPVIIPIGKNNNYDFLDGLLISGGDFDTLISSIKNTLFRLDDDVIIYPGHGPSTTIRDEINENPFLK